MEENKQEGGIWIIIGIVLVGVCVFNFIGGEQEGAIDINDCREVINLESDNLQKYYHKFTCSYIKTNDGKTIKGTCARVKLTKENECTKAYVYEKESEVECLKGYPYADVEGKCHTTWDFGRYDVSK